MPDAVGIAYNAQDFTPGGPQPMGRRSAAAGLLGAIARHGTADTLYCLTPDRAAFDVFCNQVGAATDRQRRLTWVPVPDAPELAAAGTLVRGDMGVGRSAWLRRFRGQRDFSITGLVHNASTGQTTEALASLTFAPVQEWDCVVCTSSAVKGAFERVLDRWRAYLEERGGPAAVPLRLPVLPLGVECDNYAWTADQRAEGRRRLGIGADDVVFVFVGRLVFTTKAHPIPMYLALERAAAERPGRAVHLVHCGWFATQQQELAVRRAAETFAPSVRHAFVDGSKPDILAMSWAGADVFISLADNIQETFGLTPVEALASGLPAVVSDWDGYADTVRDGEDGFRVPTRMPQPGTGAGIAYDAFSARASYWDYLAGVSAATVVDVPAAAAACARLVDDAALRARLGAQARERARAQYDWRVVIAAYEELWDELAELRAAAPEVAPPAPGAAGHPLYADPFETFGGYATASLHPRLALRLADGGARRVKQLEADAIGAFGAARRLPGSAVEAIVDRLAGGAALTVEELASPYDDPRATLTLAYLLKMGVLEENI